jgi:flavodoxin
VKAIIVYESKFGNTKQVAEEIAAGIAEADGGEATVSAVTEVDPAALGDYDAILIGSPNHAGRPVGDIKRFIDKLDRPELAGKTVAVFDTYMGPQVGKTTGRMEKRLTKNAAGLSLRSPGLSVLVSGFKGPVAEGELPRCREFGTALGKKD